MTMYREREPRSELYNAEKNVRAVHRELGAQVGSTKVRKIDNMFVAQERTILAQLGEQSWK